MPLPGNPVPLCYGLDQVGSIFGRNLANTFGALINA